MKKKLTAVLLTLCMVVGLLPMSALAVWTTSDGTEVEVAEDNTFTFNGEQYILKNPPATPEDNDTVDYYSYYNNQEGTYVGQLTWKAETEITVNVSGEVDSESGIASVTPIVPSAIQGSVEDADVVNITVSASNATGIKVPLTAETTAALSQANTAVTISSEDVGSVELPAAVVADLSGAVELTLDTKAALPSVPETSDAATKLPENAPLVDVTLTVAGEPQTTFAAAVTVSVKVAGISASVENPILVYYIDNDGKVTPEHSISVLVNGLLQWNTTHFSTWTYMTKTDAEAAGLETVVPDPDNPDTPNINVTAFPTVTEKGLGKAYAFTATAENTVLYQVVGTDNAVKSLVLTNGGTSYTVSAKAGEHVLAYVGTNIQLSSDGTYFTYDAISAAYDSAK